MSDDEDDDFLIQPVKELVSEDTYQGQHPDVEASKCSVNLALEAVDFSDSSYTTPYREKRMRKDTGDMTTTAGTKRSPPAKVPRTEAGSVWGKCEDAGEAQDSEDAAQRGPTPKEAAELAGSKAVLTPAAKRGAKASAAILQPRDGADEPVQKKSEEPTIDWENRRQTRQRQIDKGKEQIGYKRYKQVFPVPGPTDPRTPRADTRADRKTFDFELKVWKTFLHKFDPPENTDETPTPKSAPSESALAAEPGSEGPLAAEPGEAATA
jgi:hypothetical protein